MPIQKTIQNHNISNKTEQYKNFLARIWIFFIGSGILITLTPIFNESNTIFSPFLVLLGILLFILTMWFLSKNNYFFNIKLNKKRFLTKNFWFVTFGLLLILTSVILQIWIIHAQFQPSRFRGTYYLADSTILLGVNDSVFGSLPVTGVVDVEAEFDNIVVSNFLIIAETPAKNLRLTEFSISNNEKIYPSDCDIYYCELNLELENGIYNYELNGEEIEDYIGNHSNLVDVNIRFTFLGFVIKSEITHYFIFLMISGFSLIAYFLQRIPKERETMISRNLIIPVLIFISFLFFHNIPDLDTLSLIYLIAIPISAIMIFINLFLFFYHISDELEIKRPSNNKYDEIWLICENLTENGVKRLEISILDDVLKKNFNDLVKDPLSKSYLKLWGIWIEKFNIFLFSPSNTLFHQYKENKLVIILLWIIGIFFIFWQQFFISNLNL